MASVLKREINLQQTAEDTYTASWHTDWTLGATLHGGCIAAILNHAAETHLVTDPKLKAQNQPDILNLHVEFLRACTRHDSTITITTLKIGAGTSTLQLQLSQRGQLKVLALVTATNFEKPLGPSAPTGWSLSPPPRPRPDFGRVVAQQPDGNWIPLSLGGEIMNITRRLHILNPRGGFPVGGICDAWNGFRGGERIDSTNLAFLADIVPSMSDTLLRNSNLYDARTTFEKMERWAEQNPGVPFKVTTSFADAMKALTHNMTVTMDVEFKRKLPKDGLDWVFARTATKMLEGGRMDLDITICNEDMELLCQSRQVVVVADAKMKFRTGKADSRL